MARKRAVSFDPSFQNKGKGRSKGKISVDTDDKDLDSSLTFYGSPEIPDEGYVIVDHSNKTHAISEGSATPLFWIVDDSNIVETVNNLPTSTANVSTKEAAFSYLAENDYFVLDSRKEDIPTNGLVLELDPANPLSYPGTGNTMYDLSGNENDAAIYNSPSIVTTGSLGYIDFDGSNDYLQVTYTSSLSSWNTEQTIVMWLSHSISSGRRNPWDQAYGGYGTWTHEHGGNINNYFGDSGANSQPYVGYGSNSIPKGEWVMVASTRNTSQHKWYLNSSVTHTRNHSYDTLTADTNVVRIGRGYAGYWQGKMGKVIAFDKMLSADEIKQLFFSSPFAYSQCQTAKDILDTYPELQGKDGYYWVWPDGDNPIKVYCDMTTDGGGWMLVARSHPTTVNYNGTNWGWRGNQIGSPENFKEAYQCGWEYWHDNGATFTEFAFGNQRHISDNSWGPFVYKNSSLTYSTFITSDTQQSYTKSVLKSDSSIFGSTSYPSMQNAVGYASSATNSNYYYLRDCCVLAGYGGFATYFNTAYRNSNTRYNSGPWGEDASVGDDGLYEQGGTYYGSYLHVGTNQYMIMVR